MRGKIIPTYDMHGSLIRPDCYRRRLEAAHTAVRFTLTWHWAITTLNRDGGRGTNVHVTDVVNVYAGTEVQS